MCWRFVFFIDLHTYFFLFFFLAQRIQMNIELTTILFLSYLKSTSPNILEFKKRELNGFIQKILSQPLNMDTIKNFLSFVDKNGIFSLIHNKQQIFNRFRQKIIKMIEAKQGPKDRYR
jgi:hypothetical protein